MLYQRPFETETPISCMQVQANSSCRWTWIGETYFLITFWLVVRACLIIKLFQELVNHVMVTFQVGLDLFLQILLAELASCITQNTQVLWQKPAKSGQLYSTDSSTYSFVSVDDGV